MANGTGIDARQMAAAPASKREEVQAKRENRFSTAFSKIVFQAAPATAKVFEEGGNKTRKQADVTLEIAGTGLYIKGQIKAVQEPNKKPYPVFAFFGAQNRGQCVVINNSEAGAELEEYKAGPVIDAFMVWRQTNKVVNAGPQTRQELDDVSL